MAQFQYKEREGQFVPRKETDGWYVYWARTRLVVDPEHQICRATDEEAAKKIADAMNRLRQ